MPIQHAVLALLANGPSYGYELKGAFEAAVGPQWGPLNIGHLYQILDRLARDEQVVSHRVAQSVKPDRVVYEITKAGRAELAAWLAAPTPRTGGFRDDFFLKVMAAARGGDPGTVHDVITASAPSCCGSCATSKRFGGGRTSTGWPACCSPRPPSMSTRTWSSSTWPRRSCSVTAPPRSPS
jgi:DNA-binding PadR family transcriptional regulator